MISLVFVVAGLSAAFVTVARADPRPRAEHLWNRHLKQEAREKFARKAGVKKRVRIAIARATALPPEDGDRSSPPPDPAPDGADNDDALQAALFGWSDPGGWNENWPEGLLYLGLGFVGALVTAFFYMHDFLPSVGGTAEYREVSVQVAERQERLDKLRKAREDYAYGSDSEVSDERIAELNRLYEHELKQQTTEVAWLRDKKRRSYRDALPMYVLLGGVFSVGFATNPLQGLLIGFGWTAIADRTGLKRQAADREGKRDKEIEKVEKIASDQVQAATAKEQRALQEAERAKLEAALQVQVEREKLRVLRDLTGELAGRVERR